MSFLSLLDTNAVVTNLPSAVTSIAVERDRRWLPSRQSPLQDSRQNVESPPSASSSPHSSSPRYSSEPDIDLAYLWSRPLTSNIHSDVPNLDFPFEWATLETTLLDCNRGFRVDRRVATLENFDKVLQRGCRCLHYSGHGLPGGISVEILKRSDEFGTLEILSAAALAQSLSTFGKNVKLVVLSACESEHVGNALLPHVQYVIATKNQVEDDEAIDFFGGFYKLLLRGCSVHESYHNSCNPATSSFILLTNTNHLNGSVDTACLVAQLGQCWENVSPKLISNLIHFDIDIIGRNVQMQTIVSHLAQLKTDRTLTLTGIRGIGKSDLAKACAQYLLPRSMFRAIFYIKCKYISATTTIVSLCCDAMKCDETMILDDVASAVDQDSAVKTLVRIINARKSVGKILFVFDDIDSDEQRDAVYTLVSAFISKSDITRHILTSRVPLERTNPGQKDDLEEIFVETKHLSEDDAAVLLLKKLSPNCSRKLSVAFSRMAKIRLLVSERTWLLICGIPGRLIDTAKILKVSDPRMSLAADVCRKYCDEESPRALASFKVKFAENKATMTVWRPLWDALSNDEKIRFSHEQYLTQSGQGDSGGSAIAKRASALSAPIQIRSTQCTSHDGREYVYNTLSTADLGYLAIGINRSTAYQLLSSLCDNADMHDVLWPAIRVLSNNTPFAEKLRHSGKFTRLQYQSFIREPDSSGLRSDAEIFRQYVEFDVRDRLVEFGRSHLAVFVYLARIYRVHLQVWLLSTTASMNDMLEKNYEYSIDSSKFVVERQILLQSNNYIGYVQPVNSSTVSLQFYELSEQLLMLRQLQSNLDKILIPDCQNLHGEECKLLFPSCKVHLCWAFLERVTSEPIDGKRCIHSDVLKAVDVAGRNIFFSFIRLAAGGVSDVKIQQLFHFVSQVSAPADFVHALYQRTNAHQTTPYYEAVYWNLLDVVTFMNKKIAEVPDSLNPLLYANVNSFTPLRVAAWRFHLKMLRNLIDCDLFQPQYLLRSQGVSFQVDDKSILFQLIENSAQGHVRELLDILKDLLPLKVDATMIRRLLGEKSTFLQLTPLHIACSYQSDAVVDLLLSMGANPFIESLHRRPIECFSAQNKINDFIAEHKCREAFESDAQRYDKEQKYFEIQEQKQRVQLLHTQMPVELAADYFFKVNGRGETLLHCVAAQDAPDLVDIICRKIKETNQCGAYLVHDYTGCTALMTAIMYHRIVVVRKLIEHVRSAFENDLDVVLRYLFVVDDQLKETAILKSIRLGEEATSIIELFLGFLPDSQPNKVEYYLTRPSQDTHEKTVLHYALELGDANIALTIIRKLNSTLYFPNKYNRTPRDFMNHLFRQQYGELILLREAIVNLQSSTVANLLEILRLRLRADKVKIDKEVISSKWKHLFGVSILAVAISRPTLTVKEARAKLDIIQRLCQYINLNNSSDTSHEMPLSLLAALNGETEIVTFLLS